MKLPKAYKNFALAGTPAGGVTPHRKEEGDVKACNFDFGIARLKKKEGLKAAVPAPLIKFGDFKFTIDKKWVSAKPLEAQEIPKSNQQEASYGASNRGHKSKRYQLARDAQRGQSETSTKPLQCPHRHQGLELLKSAQPT